MRLRLLFFGVLKDVLSAAHETIEVEQGSTVADVVGLLEARSSNGKDVWKSLAVAVNREYANGQVVLQDNDEVALLPPVTGG